MAWTRPGPIPRESTMKYIHTKVTSGAREEIVKEKSPDHFEISVREKSERNMANARVIELVSLHFKIPKNKVRIVNGHRSPSKLLVLEI
jgi:uncharacterized protein YggU (UPF0235/DUF167 family)